MKKVLALVVLAVMFLGSAVPSYAGELGAPSNPTAKLGRGILNIFDGLVEVPGTMIRDTKKDNLAVGMTKGIVHGMANTCMRLLGGAYEIVTFPVPVPANYAQMMEDPKFLKSE
ncbi:MAG: exosortase system-associated protein, TIGR04073 family [Candidatus Omnitrophica bacterium]|nr:exosortase system-associated protein, TIGR04073 family [Candidatus Omnitrophota bacterium]